MQVTAFRFARPGEHYVRQGRPAAGARSSRSLLCHTSLPSIRDFIQNECPMKGLDGVFREQSKAATLTTTCIATSKDSLVVPGQRRLFEVSEQQLERIIEDQGQVIICCFEKGSTTKLAAPARGSWACLGAVAGLQRLPGSSRALVRVLVRDRAAVQALATNNPYFVRATSALLRDRWCYFVRTAAVEQHLATDSSSSSSPPGRDVTGAVEQVQDATSELMQVMEQLAGTVASAIDSPAHSQLQQQLIEAEAGDELADLLAWCQLAGPMDVQSSSEASSSSSNSSSGGGVVPADALLLEKAWRLSFAPFASKGLAAALQASSSGGSSSDDAKGVCEALETVDLGLRLEAALDVAQQLRSRLATQLALTQL